MLPAAARQDAPQSDALARKRNPRLIYLCDPVIGDDDLGVLVADGMVELFRSQLVPQPRS